MSLSQKQISNCSRSVGLALDVLRRPIPEPLADWADKHFYMSPECSYVEGPWRTKSYQRVPMNLMGNDAVQELDVVKSARIGYSKMIMASVAYQVEHRRRNQIIYQPTDGAAAKFMKEHVEPMIRDVKPVKALASWYGKKHPNNTRDSKLFDNRRQLWCMGGTSAKNFREKSADTIVMDEIDGFDENVDLEGRPDLLALKRNEGSYFPKFICGSTPTLEHRSLIHARTQDAECLLKCFIPCPHCDHEQDLVFEQMICQVDHDPSTVAYLCISCGELFDHTASLKAQERCRWIDEEVGICTIDGLEFFSLEGPPVETPRHVALHIWSAYSDMTTWEKIMRDFFARKNNPVAFQTWVNQTRGQVWKQKGQAPDWKRIYDRTRRSELERNKLAPWALLLTCGVDVQGNRLELEIVGWGREKRSQSVDYRVIMGNPTDLSAQGPWEELRRIIQTETWESANGVPVPLSCTAIDSGNNSQNVYAFCREFAQPQVVPIKGTDNQQTLIGIPKAVDVTQRGRTVRRGTMLWRVGVNIAKAELYAWLRQERPTEESGDPLPPGWCDFPEYGEDYFKQLTAEQLVTRKNRRGYSVHQWEKIRERNEVLDCRVYSRAAATIRGLDRWNELDWTALEDELGLRTRAEREADQDPGVYERNGMLFRRSSFWAK